MGNTGYATQIYDSPTMRCGVNSMQGKLANGFDMVYFDLHIIANKVIVDETDITRNHGDNKYEAKSLVRSCL
jgi:hypothetical protein